RSDDIIDERGRPCQKERVRTGYNGCEQHDNHKDDQRKRKYFINDAVIDENWINISQLEAVAAEYADGDGNRTDRYRDDHGNDRSAACYFYTIRCPDPLPEILPDKLEDCKRKEIDHYLTRCNIHHAEHIAFTGRCGPVRNRTPAPCSYQY